MYSRRPLYILSSSKVIDLKKEVKVLFNAQLKKYTEKQLILKFDLSPLSDESPVSEIKGCTRANYIEIDVSHAAGWCFYYFLYIQLQFR